MLVKLTLSVSLTRFNILFTITNMEPLRRNLPNHEMNIKCIKSTHNNNI